MKDIISVSMAEERMTADRRDTELLTAVSLLESMGARVVDRCPAGECAVCRPPFDLAA